MSLSYCIFGKGKMKKQTEYFLKCLACFGLMGGEQVFAEDNQVTSEEIQVVIEEKIEVSEAPVQSEPIAQVEEKKQETLSSTQPPLFVSTYDRVQGKEILPSYGPVVSNGADVYVQASYIYWYMSELGLEFAGTNLANVYYTSATSNNLAPKGKVYNPGNKASSGFKVGGGIDFDYDGWDLGAQYTWYRNQHSNVVSCPINMDEESEDFFYPVENIAKLFDSPGNSLFLMSGYQNLKLNVIDLSLSRSFFFSPKFIFKASCGLKGTWVKQVFNIKEAVSAPEISTAYPVEEIADDDPGQIMLNVYNKQYNWGLGTRFGLETDWLFTKSFSLFGQCAVTALWQYVKTERTDVYDAVYNTFEDPQGTVLSDYTDVRYHQIFHTVNPVLETQIGFRYDYFFSKDQYRVRVEAAWETQVWFNQNTFLTQYGQNQAYQNLALQGLTLNFRADF